MTSNNIETPNELPNDSTPILSSEEMAQTPNELSLARQLALSERALQIYREQVKCLQEHLSNMRVLNESKDRVIQNLTLRFDLGILPHTSASNTATLPVDDKEMRRRAEALAQRTILENFES